MTACELFRIKITNMECKKSKFKLIYLVAFGVIGFCAFYVLHVEIYKRVQYNSPNIRGNHTTKNEDQRTRSGPQRIPSNRPKVLCLILTTIWKEDRHKAVNDTWARRCDRAIFVIGKVSKNGKKGLRLNENVLQLDVEDKRSLLPHKVYRAFENVYHRYKTNYDWIMKCDDDTYVIMDNLQRFLSNLSHEIPSYVGYRFKVELRDGYMSGGAGYVISSAGLQKVFTTKNISSKYNKAGSEDIEMAKCFREAGLKIIDSWDEKGKERFNPEPLGNLLYPPYTTWMNTYGWKRPVFGFGCCSPYVISFHHLTPRDMYVYEHLLYNTRVSWRETSS